MFRIIVDCPLGEDESKAAELAKDFLGKLKELANIYGNDEFGGLQMRLSKDGTRAPLNYLEKDGDRILTRKTPLF